MGQEKQAGVKLGWGTGRKAWGKWNAIEANRRYGIKINGVKEQFLSPVEISSEKLAGADKKKRVKIIFGSL